MGNRPSNRHRPSPSTSLFPSSITNLCYTTPANETASTAVILTLALTPLYPVRCSAIAAYRYSIQLPTEQHIIDGSLNQRRNHQEPTAAAFLSDAAVHTSSGAASPNQKSSFSGKPCNLGQPPTPIFLLFQLNNN